ncbi:MAG: phosphodiester glycosidase family protein [Planctomycetota bacterium]
MRSTLINLTASACLLLSASWVAAQPLTVRQVQIAQPGGQARGWVAHVDLTDPSVEVLVTGPAPGGTGGDAVLRRTDQWRADNNADVAINANFFGSLGGGVADIVGLSASDGVIVSSWRQFGATPDPALVIDPNNVARIDYINGANITPYRDAIAGVGPSNTDSDPGTLLVDNGANLGATARVQPGVRNPRTAVGVSQDGNTLIMAVIDGRQPSWSVGMTLPELGQFMIDEGAWDAINLDGGGSSSFVYQEPGQPLAQNRPSDGQHRSVANHLGIRIAPPVTVDQQYARPVRGVWLRPPNSQISTLDVYMQVLADAGVTDLFLESFYWGLATNDSDVFQDRYSFDYLAEAIRVGATHGMRVHAWLESGYWSFGSNGQYLFTEVPDSAVVHVSDPTNTGDIAGQTFANLGNPGVQQMMADYCAELALYPGLWGIQTDYHRFPANAGNNQAPWSYDAWARAEFQNQFGVDPLVSASGPGAPFWNQWVQFRRDGVSEAANVMHQAINASPNPGLAFSAAVFATADTSASQASKLQEWPVWTDNDYVEWIVPMAYGFSTSSISNDLVITLNKAGDNRVVAGLAILTNATRPSIPSQLNTAKILGIDDWILFSGQTLIDNIGLRNDLRDWIDTQSVPIAGDFDNDEQVDPGDFALFAGVYSGSPVAVNPLNAVYDLNEDNVIDAADEQLLRDIFAAHRFGEDGVVDAIDLQALLNTWTGPGPGAPVDTRHLYDLDSDGDVDYDDQLIFHTYLTVDIGPDLDVDRSGEIDVEDLYSQSLAPIDVNRDGVVTPQDSIDLIGFYRADELERMSESFPQ